MPGVLKKPAGEIRRAFSYVVTGCSLGRDLGLPTMTADAAIIGAQLVVSVSAWASIVTTITIMFAGVGIGLPALIAAGSRALIGAVLGGIMHEHNTIRVREQLERVDCCSG
jgi:hypothetical protein